MKKFFKDEVLYKKYVSHIMTGIVLILFYFVIAEFSVIRGFFGKLISILSPFIWGAVLAFILLKLANRLEKILPIENHRTNRFISSLISVLILIAIIVIFFSILIPQIIESVSQLAGIIDNFTKNATSWLGSVSSESFLPQEVINDLYKYSSSIISTLWELAKTSIPNIIDFTKNTVSGILNFVIGFIVALYILIDRDNLAYSFKRLFKAFLSSKNYSKAGKIMVLAYDKFSSFLVGKVIDSVIIGILCFVIMSILKLDFAVLISVIVGVTNIIPFFGPFIGAVPSALILLIVSPSKALIFIIMIFVLQQIDGNIIGPKILGGSVGLSSLWIMFAIIVGGGYFGFMGMLLGVPVFAIIYFTIKEYVDDKLKGEEMNG